MEIADVSDGATSGGGGRATAWSLPLGSQSDPLLHVNRFYFSRYTVLHVLRSNPKFDDEHEPGRPAPAGRAPRRRGGSFRVA